ncbi:hypothetical protein WHR41_02505 [Cladosporium halotolerans]|uniref:Uncharacterized protein n=1 Tax=Cladosporium halotolerans TaxID=1052096 RepID=A0AB34KWK4_9PEZI
MTTSSDEKLHLLTLPPEIREHIYRLILDPEANRNYGADEYITYNYARALVLFKINRQIYREAHKIFCDLNAFVRIETPWSQSKEHVMAEGHVPIVIQDERAKTFKYYRLLAGIDAPQYQLLDVDTECFIIHVDDLAKFTKSWFYADLSHPTLNPNLRLSLSLHDPFHAEEADKQVPYSLQRKLLYPWASVRNLGQMTFVGAPSPDPKIVSELEAAQAKPIASPEECLNESTRLKREGNVELQAGRYSAALSLYKQSWEAIHITVHGHARHVHGDAFFAVRLRQPPYQGKLGQAERLVLRVQLVANTCLAYLKSEQYDECIFWGMRTINTVRDGMGIEPDMDVGPHEEAVPGFPAATEMGKVYWRTALAWKAKDEKSEARRLAKVAMVYLPSAGDQKALEQLLRDCMLRI